MKIGIMGGSYNGTGEITTKVYEIAKTLSKYDNFVMGPNETGLLRKVKMFYLKIIKILLFMD